MKNVKHIKRIFKIFNAIITIHRSFVCRNAAFFKDHLRKLLDYRNANLWWSVTCENYRKYPIIYEIFFIFNFTSIRKTSAFILRNARNMQLCRDLFENTSNCQWFQNFMIKYFNLFEIWLIRILRATKSLQSFQVIVLKQSVQSPIVEVILHVDVDLIFHGRWEIRSLTWETSFLKTKYTWGTNELTAYKRTFIITIAKAKAEQKGRFLFKLLKPNLCQIFRINLPKYFKVLQKITFRKISERKLQIRMEKQRNISLFSITVNVRYLSSYLELGVPWGWNAEKEERHQQQAAREEKRETKIKSNFVKSVLMSSLLHCTCRNRWYFREWKTTALFSHHRRVHYSKAKRVENIEISLRCPDEKLLLIID